MLRIATLPLSIQPQIAALLSSAAVLIPALLAQSSMTPCELWLNACVLHQRTTFQSSQASNLLSFVAMERRCLLHAVPWSLDTCSTQHSPVHRVQMHGAIECKCMTPICTCRTTTHQFIWQQQHMCGALSGLPMECGVGGQPHKTPYLYHWHPPLWNDPPKNSLGLTHPPPHQCRMFPLLVQMGYGLFCGLWLWRRRTNHRPCCPPIHQPPYGVHSLAVLDDETIEWLLNTCREI